ncbi:MFS transporter [Anabaena sp. FACHB-1237]|uniref:MFS transporter n=1 Tax=Anabaena sp. FACHB-1237 TaxID=2692769 RepID=UPI00167FF17C|nr:MFS transporter [Anabaena sp. FACHB-1237]MBD2136140.1 MFS transporter [Anabaena sp. FACHB-1237]
MRNFTFIWIGQLISLIGTWMASFALDIWVFQKTGSATQFALVTITTSLPLVLVSPIAGTLIDRWNRRWTVIISDACIGICILIFTISVSTGQLQVWHIYLINTFISLFSGFQNPAYKALITCLVPIEKLHKVSGMVQLAFGIQQIASPLLAGLLLSIIDIQGILIIDLSTVIIALIPLLMTKVVEISQYPVEETQKVSFWQEMIYGWKYLQESSGLLEFLILYTIYQFLVGCVFVLAYPLVLSLTTSSQLGIIMFVGGLGILTTSLIISKWGNQWENLTNIVITAMIFSGLWIAIAGLRPSILQISICTLLFFLCSPIINGLTQVIFQKKVPPQVQGRIFAITGAISTAGLPVAAVFAAPLADNILEPLMDFNGPWANNIIGQIIGSGPGRGIALLFVILGLFTLIITLIGSQYPTIRKL